MKKIILITILLLFFGTLSAQVHEIQQTRNALSSINAIGTAASKAGPMVRGFDHSYKGVLGTPYLSEDWDEGILEEKNGKIHPDVYLRYDMVDDFVKMRDVYGKTFIFSKKQIKAFRIYKTAETFTTFQVFPEPVVKKKGDPNFFAEVMNDGALQLLIRRRKYLVPKDNAISPYHTQTNDAYKFRAKKYYLIFKGEETPIPLKRSKKFMLGIMEKHRDEIENFIKQKQLSIANDYHLALIIDHYNQLEAEKVSR